MLDEKRMFSITVQTINSGCLGSRNDIQGQEPGKYAFSPSALNFSQVDITEHAIRCYRRFKKIPNSMPSISS